MPEQMSISQAAASRRLAVSATTVSKLVRLGKLACDERGKPLLSAVNELEQRRVQRIYERVSGSQSPAAYACPTTTAEMGGTLFLQEPGHVAEAKRMLAIRDLPTTDQFSGFWEMSDAEAERLEEENGILLGVAGGFVFEAAKVVCLAGTIDYRNRKVFAIEQLTGDALTNWFGFVPNMLQIPTAVI